MHDAIGSARRGGHPVGVTTLHVEDPETPGRHLPVDVWYPADPAIEGRDLDPNNGTDHPFGQHHAAVASAPPAAGAFPLLAFSHGNSGLRRQSTFLTTHLASWGFVVVAPDHVGNTFPEMLLLDVEQRRIVHREARINRPRDVRTSVAAASAGGEGLPRVRADRIGVLGHSFGGWTAMKMPAREGRVSAVCGLAPASEPFVGRRAFDEGELPFRSDVATLIVAGSDDVLVDLETSVRPLFDRLAAPRSLVAVDGMDHFHFCDGIGMLHGNHIRTPREGLTRSVRPLQELLAQDRSHRILQGLVTAFFLAALDGGTVPNGMGDLDPAARVLV
jgi:predicted dienelactone hydrolase